MGGWIRSSILLSLVALAFSPATSSPSRPYIVSRWYSSEEVDHVSDDPTPFTDCGQGDSATVDNVQVIPCDDEDICDLKTGRNATVKINFVPKSDVKSLKAVVHGIVASIPIAFHFPQPNACEKSNIVCPLKKDQSYSYQVELPVLSTYPRIRVTVKWELKDEKGKDVVCVEIPVKIV